MPSENALNRFGLSGSNAGQDKGRMVRAPEVRATIAENVPCARSANPCSGALSPRSDVVIRAMHVTARRNSPTVTPLKARRGHLFRLRAGARTVPCDTRRRAARVPRHLPGDAHVQRERAGGGMWRRSVRRRELPGRSFRRRVRAQLPLLQLLFAPQSRRLDHRRPRCASGAHDVVDRIGSTPAVARAGRHPARPQAPPRVANRNERTG